MGEVIFRKANINDIPFLVDTIIEAEESGTKILTYSTIFGIAEDYVRKYLAEMLAEETDGCELSLSSFLIAEINNQNVAAVSAWVEGIGGVPSVILKGNLLKYTLPKECLDKAKLLSPILQEMNIEYIPNSIQIGLVYVLETYRGLGLVNQLIEEQIRNLMKECNPTDVYIQVFGDNIKAIKAYEKANFQKVLVKNSSYNDILNYMPSATKILMKRNV